MSENTEENVGQLDGETPIERVILQDDVKLFRYRAVLAYLDGSVYDFSQAKISFENDLVPVFSEDRSRHLGFAKVELETVGGSKRLIADISIDYASEERLLAETQEVKVYPRICGRQGFPVIALFDFQGRLPVTFLRVDGVILSRKRPTDERVVAFGTTVL